MALRSALLRVLTQRSKHNYFAFVPSREEHEEHYRQYNNGYRKNRYKIGATTTLLGAVVLGANVNDRIENNITLKTKDVANKAPSKDKNGDDDDDTFEAGGKIPGLPSYSAEEVSKHDSTESFWVTYKNGVYDVTEFLVSHPGGEQILHAAGLSIEPFWNVYGMHKTPEIYRLLESFRIGNLNDEDVVDHSEDELWVKEPFRDKRLIVKTEKPFNAEIPAKYQIAHFDTPNELFYVRQHMPVPELNASTHTLEITIVGDKRTTHHKFTLEELMLKFRPASVRAALMCAGNRRSEMDKVKPVKGISWAGGAISNAVWSGVYLREVLLYCGVDLENTEGKHVVFRGSDIDATGVQFSTSIPLSQAGGAAARVLLATHMNGVPLPPDHGAPLRVVVPGAPAVRSVKWLESITISEEESPSHWHQKDYRSFNSTKTWETADFSTAPPIYSLPVTSAICDPSDSDTVRVKNGCIEVKGYAYSGGGAKIIRVDVSPNGGQSWVEAELQADPAPPQYHYSWTLFTAQVPVERGQTEVELWAKATDSNFNTQPETFEHIWNIRGILSNAYHRIKVRLQH